MSGHSSGGVFGGKKPTSNIANSNSASDKIACASATTSAAMFLLARLWITSVGSFHELIVRLQRRIPLDHPPISTLTILATAVSNGQLGITHEVPRSAMRTTKGNVMGGRWAAHNYIVGAIMDRLN